MEMMNFCTFKAQPQQLETTKQKQQLMQAQIGPKTSCIEQTIIRKVFKQEVSTMPQQATQQTHISSQEYFEFPNASAATNIARTVVAKIKKSLATKRINKQKYKQQKEQNKEQKNYSNKACMSTINFGKQQYELMPHITAERVETKTNITIPAVRESSLIPLASSTLLLSSSLKETALPAIPTPTPLEEATTFTNKTDIENDENSQNEIQKCNNVCSSSKFSLKQKCMQHKKQQQHCKSANISCNKNNSNTSFYRRQTTNNMHLAEANKATNTTTNKANIISYTTFTTSSNINKHLISTANSAAKATATKGITTATRPIAISTTVLPSPLPAATISTFPLRQLLKNTKQLECLLNAAMFSFVFIITIMSMQFQTVTASSHEPMFISRSETFKFVAGDTIVLPCEVANTDPYVVAWKRGIAILTAGSVKVTPDPRVRLVNGFNLQIRDAVPQDAGDYICQIATMEPREITHTVEILVPPRIHHISTSGHLQVKKGSSVRIECSASGNPTPNVTWSRKNNILPNGEEKLHSHILSIENVDRHKGGIYICTANNGVGQPASSQVVLHVLYPPEITVERPVVFSGEGHEAMLVCIVHGETQPEVIWFKDTMQLDTTERHIMENRGSRHTLIIRKVHPQDFGNYSCVAENQLGKSRKTLQLSGKPNVAVFNSPPISQYKDRYNISWTVESHTPIEEYKLSFRRLQQGQEVDNSIDSHSSHSSSSSSSSSILQMYGSSMSMNSGSMMGGNAHNYRLGGMGNINGMIGTGGYGSYGAGNVIHWGRNDWRDVVLPAIPTSHHYTQGMSYMIRGLDPDQHYEATVQARNRYGWSDYSQSFVFSTSSNDNEMRDLSVTFYGSKAARVETFCNLLFLTAVSLCIRIFYFSNSYQSIYLEN